MARFSSYEERPLDFNNDTAILQLLLCNSTICNSTNYAKNFSVHNKTMVFFEAKYGMWHVATTSVLLGMFILCTIIGNVFVVAAIILEKNLQSVSNYLILSLAVADLMVATLVMPISALKELSKNWWLGIELCDIWTCFDVLCCTASILHLCAIAIDRYWAVTNVDYIRRRTAKRIIGMIVLVWTISIVISIPARFYIGRTRSAQFEEVQINGNCDINQELGFTVFSTVGAFYFPMLFMLAIYARIYQTARARIRRKHFQKSNNKSSTSCAPTPKISTATVPSPKNPKNRKKKETKKESSNSESPEVSLIVRDPVTTTHANNNHTGNHDNDNDNEDGDEDAYQSTSFTNNPAEAEAGTGQVKQNGKISTLLSPKVKRKVGRQEKSATESQRERLEHKRERKAARTLAIITGCFLLCWLPFFIHATVMPFCFGHCPELPPLLLSFFLWLGYLNSLLNPVIYTIFSPDFRNAFRKILFGRYYKGGGGRR